MRNLFLLFCSCALVAPLFSQSYKIFVGNGYTERGTANAGDTVHIWSQEWGTGRTFNGWSGDTAALERPNEWHTRVIMPARDVTVIANFRNLPTGSANPFKFEQIQGALLKKPVYSYFPAGGSPRLVVWLWHGTGSGAGNWIWRNFEMRQFCNYLIANDIALIITESDESTLNIDLDGDGEIRYDWTPDTTTNRDLWNVRAIRDTFLRRGKISWATPMAAAGFSAGGVFSAFSTGLMHWQSAVSHNGPGDPTNAAFINIPALFSMCQNDDHPAVGPVGNQATSVLVQTLRSQGKCAQYHLLRPSPLYPQRFRRIPGIYAAKSAALFNELDLNGCLDAKRYLTKSPNQITAQIAAEPAKWPTLLSFNDTLRQWIKDELAVNYTSHHLHTDIMAADLAFLLRGCSPVLDVQTIENEALVSIFPNPTSGEIWLETEFARARVFDLAGQLVLEKTGVGEHAVDVSGLPGGVYFLEIFSGNGRRRVGRFVKI